MPRRPPGQSPVRARQVRPSAVAWDSPGRQAPQAPRERPRDPSATRRSTHGRAEDSPPRDRASRQPGSAPQARVRLSHTCPHAESAPRRDTDARGAPDGDSAVSGRCPKQEQHVRELETGGSARERSGLCQVAQSPVRGSTPPATTDASGRLSTPLHAPRPRSSQAAAPLCTRTTRRRSPPADPQGSVLKRVQSQASEPSGFSNLPVPQHGPPGPRMPPTGHRRHRSEHWD